MLVVACGSNSNGSSTPTPAGSAQASTSSPAVSATEASPTLSTAPVTLTIFAAGTLAGPFNEIDKAFSAKYPNVKVEAQFGGSVAEVKQVTQLGMQADVVGVADYTVIPKYMFAPANKQFASWYIGFASNAITFVYMPGSKGASTISADNWYQVLSQPGIQIGRSNPDTDPSGYQTLQMLNLAEQYYKVPGLAAAILKNAPSTNIRNTETDLLGALQAGQIDYLAIYRSDAIQHKLKYLDLPSAINLSDASQASAYAKATVQTANGSVSGNPIIYAVTIPTNAPHADWAERWVAFLLGPDGQKVLSTDGFGAVTPGLANDQTALPASLKSLTAPWPSH